MSDDFFLLPEALMLDIWLRLSIKSTVRFRCVSKPWCASLSDPHFIYKNLTFSSNDDDLLLVNWERPHYSLVSHETLTGTPFLVPPEVPNPRDEDVVTPPCDDMVCFYHSFEEYMGVWNLATGETKMITAPAFDDDGYSFHYLTHGFGFDEKRKEYKIVQILKKRELNRIYRTLGRDDHSFVAYVYTLSSSSSNNGWRKVVGEPNMPVDNYGDDYFAVAIPSRSYRDGTFCWGAVNLIVSFDMSTEVFNMIYFPFLNGPLSGITDICKLKEGSMLVIARNRTSESMEYEIWGLLELGVTQSWTKLLVIDWRSRIRDVPLGFWRNELVVTSHSDGRLMIGDPFVQGDIKEIQIDESSDDIPKCLMWTKGKEATPWFSECLVWTKGKNASSSSLLSGLQLPGEELE